MDVIQYINFLNGTHCRAVKIHYKPSFGCGVEWCTGITAKVLTSSFPLSSVFLGE